MTHRSAVRQRVASADEILLEVGYKTAFGAAALVGTLLVGLATYERWGGLLPPQQPLAPSDIPSDLTYTAEAAESAGAEAALFSMTPHAPEALVFAASMVEPVAETIPASGLPASIDSNADLYALIHQPQLSDVSSVRFVGAPFNLEAPRPATNDTGAFAPRRRTGVQSATLSAALNDMADDLATGWQEPDVRDLSLFIASDDKALAWSFTEASPNYGGVTYQEDRVDIGSMAAGVSLGLQDMQLSLAYVEREDAAVWGYRQEEEYAGVILTLTR